mgnify:FL=1
MSFLKKLLIKEEFLEKETPVKEVKKESNSTLKFPSSNTTTISKTPENHILPKGELLTQSCEQHMDKLLDVYQKAFDKLNKDGYDFYEYMDGVFTVDETGSNPMAHTMQFKMAKNTNPSVTKDSLLTDAEYYKTEINKTCDGYVINGNNKKQELLNQKTEENNSLTNELSMLQQQAESIKIQIEDKQNKLSKIDDKYLPQLNEVDCKLIANEAAKNKIISTIDLIKTGIETNIK